MGPLIVARQRQMAERQAELSGATSTQTRNPARPDPVRAPYRTSPSRSAVAGDLGLGSANQRDADRTRALKEQAGEDKNAQGRSTAEQDVVAKLKARDAEVRQHEQAHAAVGGQYAVSPTYTYQTGPDGQRYAIGGAVSIDVAAIDGDPAATIAKMEIVKAAALAPAEPSSADRQVAALADTQRAQAVADLAALRSKANGEDVDRRV